MYPTIAGKYGNNLLKDAIYAERKKEAHLFDRFFPMNCVGILTIFTQIVKCEVFHSYCACYWMSLSNKIALFCYHTETGCDQFRYL